MEENACKGLVFRGSTNNYCNTNEKLSQKAELRLLKRKSCAGCERCVWIWEFLQEDIENYLDLSKIKHGKLYIPNIVTSLDFESGYTEVDYIEFKEVKENSA